jgi:hypothetical protein
LSRRQVSDLEVVERLPVLVAAGDRQGEAFGGGEDEPVAEAERPGPAGLLAGVDEVGGSDGVGVGQRGDLNAEGE